MSMSTLTENKDLYDTVKSVREYLDAVGSSKKNLLPSSLDVPEAHLRSQVEAFINHCKV